MSAYRAVTNVHFKDVLHYSGFRWLDSQSSFVAFGCHLSISVRWKSAAGDVPSLDAATLAPAGTLGNLDALVFGNACPNVLHQPTFGAVVIALQRVFNPNARTLQFIFDEQLLS
jgi:hypothetical protein